jgi:ubiquinone/menaquinone biosynthesis C-methylase UbiE
MIKAKLLQKLACPTCKGELRDAVKLQCSGCGKTYDVLRGIPNFLPLYGEAKADKPSQDLQEEQQFYQNLYSDLNGLDDGHCVVYGYDDLYAFMKDVPTGSLLDLGCGPGQHAKDLALKGYDVTGIDVSHNGLRHAQQVNDAHGLESSFVLGDIENLPFKDRAFDVVFCGLILHHFPRLDRVLSEIARVCNSHIVAFEVNANDPASFLRFNVLNPLGLSKVTRNQRAIWSGRLQRRLDRFGFTRCERQFIDVHHYTGRHQDSLQAKAISAYRTLFKLLPEKYHCNKFMLKCSRSSAS